ncbi:MAG: GNAT family N-acetyltransferase [Flavobacteriales bacterium TMED96]|nr:MAG: GNAT family N-acetyltransferase [Flavobacteriales bacterium TMED96]|tara:strand:+ start:806 stop:1207 length:402 start_codon:yes stop_codon:yes gene_type:complete
MKIERGKFQDAESLTTLMKDGFGWKNKGDMSKDFFSNKNIFCLVAKNKKNEIMGTSTLHIIEKVNRRIGLIEDVVVSKKFRGKLVASSIIKKLISISKKEGCYKTILNTDSKTESFYKKLGFAQKNLQMEIRF